MYKIKAMDIEGYDEIINLWKNTDGVGLSGSDDSKKSIKIFLVALKKNKIGNIFWENNGYETRKDLNYRDKRIIG